MSVVFSIPNKKKIFGSEPVLTVEECLNLKEGLIQFSVDESEEDFEPEEFYTSPLSRFECLVVGIDGESGRGFEISYEEKSKTYGVRVNTPAAASDWELAISFMQALARRLGSPIVKEDGERFTAESIGEFEYEKDIDYGIRIFCDKALENGSSILFGIFRPIYIDRKLAEHLLGSGNRIADFGELLQRTQYSDAYAARQQFYRNKEDDSILGVYTLTQELPTILPYEPYVEFGNLEALGERKVKNWRLTFVCYEDENASDSYYTLGDMNYSDFIQALKPEKYYFLDGGYIVVEGLTREEMEEILGEK